MKERNVRSVRKGRNADEFFSRVLTTRNVEVDDEVPRKKRQLSTRYVQQRSSKRLTKPEMGTGRFSNGCNGASPCSHEPLRKGEKIERERARGKRKKSTTGQRV